eukprot:COSAG04_NODE_1855_length_5385_cov_4.796443_2_plen_426_part_00
MSGGGVDYTKLALGNTKYHNLDNSHNIFTPLTVRTIDNNQALRYGVQVQEVAAQGLAVLHSDFRILRKGDTYHFELPRAMFPTDIADKGDVFARLARDAPQQHHVDYPQFQINKGYVLELIDWSLGVGDENKLAEANEYFVTGLRYGGIQNENGAKILFDTDKSNIPLSLYNVINPLLTAAAGNAIVLGGRARAANGDLTPNGQRGDGGNDDNFNDRIWTWNLFAATTVDGITHGFPSATDNHCNYTVTIPNTVGYPEHKRCLVQVQSLAFHAEAHFVSNHTTRLNPIYIGVEAEGLGVQQNFSSHTNLSSSNRFNGRVSDSNVIGYLNLTEQADFNALRPDYTGFVYTNNRSILDDGVLCSSPFGKQLRIKFLNLTNKSILNTNSADGAIVRLDEHDDPTDIIHNPTHLTLRLLFLDDDDLPMR